MKSLICELSKIGTLESDSENTIDKKIAFTLLPFYVSLPAVILSFMYLYFGNFQAFLIPTIYLGISIFSLYYLYKTKKFMHFEVIQLTMILFLPFILMWVLGGFNASSFVFIWAFYAPIAVAMYNDNQKIKIAWFAGFITLLLISAIINESLIRSIDHQFPNLLLDIFFFLNIGAGLGGIYLLLSHFICDIKSISNELKRDRESLYNLTHDLKNANQELEHLANSDVVTQLPNRLYFTDIVYKMFALAKRHEKQVAILFLDLDGFKSVNDTLGHEAGDLILKVVGERLTKIVRASDTVARVGGDEFAISLGEISDPKHVESIAKTIIKEVNESCSYKGDECHVGVSIGISFYPSDGEEIEELLKKADEAMYTTKKEGKNNFSIYSGLKEES